MTCSSFNAMSGSRRIEQEPVFEHPGGRLKIVIVVAGEEDFVEAVILLPDQATVDVFRKGEGALEQTAAHDSASSFTGPASTCKAYAIADDSIFNLCLNGELQCRS